MGKRYDIFISYRRVDSEGRTSGRDIARTIQQALEKQFRVFLDFDELEDGVFDQRIIDAINESPVFLLVLSKGALDRCVNEKDWVRQEIMQAVKSGCHIVPVTIIGDDFNGLPHELPKELRRAVGSHQFSQLHMETLFKESMAKLVKTRIAPYINKEQNVTGAEIHIETDADCQLFHFNKILALIYAGKDNVVRLKRGKHKLKFVSVEFEDIKYLQILEIPNEDYTDFVEVKMRGDIETKRKTEEEKAKRKAAEMRELVVFEQDGKYGFKDYHTGEVFIPCMWKSSEEQFSEGLAYVMNDNDKYGFIDKVGSMVIPCKWEKAGPFSEGLAPVLNHGGKWGYIDKTGDVVVPCKWKRVFSFVDGLAIVQDDNEKYGCIDKKGNVVILCKWKELFVFHNGLAIVQDVNNRQGFINKKGEEVIPCIWKEVWDFKEELAPVLNHGGKWGYIDKTGDVVIPCKWKRVFNFHGGYARVQDDNEKWGTIDKTGNVVIPCKWEES